VRPTWVITWWRKSTTRLAVGNVSQRKGVRREAESVGSKRQSPEPMYRNRI